MSVETRAPRWAPETDLQWGPRHLDSHREKTTGTSGALTLWLCCRWNKLLVRLARGKYAPQLSLVSLKVFFSVLSPMEFCLLSWGHLISSDIVYLIEQILLELNWAGWWHQWMQWWTAFNKNLIVYYCLFALLTHYFLIWYNLYC